MARNDRAIALQLIRDANLEHPILPLAESFILDASDSDQAAKFLIKICSVDSSASAFTNFVRDWGTLVELISFAVSQANTVDSQVKKETMQRDNYKCCITAARPPFWSSFSVFPIIDPHALLSIQEGPLYEILGAFIGQSQRDLLLTPASPKVRTSYYWTLSPEAATAFQRGDIRLERIGANEYDIRYTSIRDKRPAIYTADRRVEWRSSLIDHSGFDIACPDPLLLEVQGKFSTALKWNYIKSEITRNHRQHTEQLPDKKSAPIAWRILHTIWLKAPTGVRLITYKFLRSVGSHLYGSSISMGVQRLPFGLYLKHGPKYHFDRHLREYTALKLVRNHTKVPAPQPIDLISSRTESLLVTSRLEGEPAGVFLHYYTDGEMLLMARDLREYVAELRKIPKATSEYAITGVTGGSCLDYRIDADVVGPFRDEREFSESLRLGILPDLVHRHDHDVFFTHADLNMRNILVKDGRISGIIDWENAGWYPEYWEYTKCYFGVRMAQRWLRMIDEVFENKYKEELRIDKQYWEYVTPF